MTLLGAYALGLLSGGLLLAVAGIALIWRATEKTMWGRSCLGEFLSAIGVSVFVARLEAENKALRETLADAYEQWRFGDEAEDTMWRYNARKLLGKPW